MSANNEASAKLNVVTGATGQLGSHIVEQLRTANERVRALVRDGSDVRFLEQQGAEIVRGDLRDTQAVSSAIAGGDVVYHCAARVSDWGPWQEFADDAMIGTRNVVDACKAAQVKRLLHVSSISVYGHPKLAAGQNITEDTPLGQRFWMWDYYPQAKLLAEKIAWEYPDVTIVRPSWIYGPRDRVTIPRLVPALKGGKVPIIGSGGNMLNIIYAGDVAAGAILAANTRIARGEAYNLCSEGEITQRDLLNTLTDLLKLPRIGKKVPFALALRFAWVKEAWARLMKQKTPPTITRRAIYLVGRSTRFSIAKAKSQLGWQPTTRIQEGVSKALAGYFQNQASTT